MPLGAAKNALLVAALVATVCVVSSEAQRSVFLDFVKQRFSSELRFFREGSISIDSICPIERDPLARRVFFDYGAMFVASRDVRVPRVCVFKDGEEVERFQSRLDTESEEFENVEIELQQAAMKRLVLAREEAARVGLRITPLDGAIAGRRSYSDTVRIWNSRFHRALDHWVRRGKIKREDADAVRFAPVAEQVARVAAWEARGLYFSTNLSSSIFYSVAPPGTSQHLSLLAFDVVEAGNPAVRRILNKYGWFQTIRTDQPHFTYLGVDELELPRRGLRNVYHQGNSYWIPAEN